MQVKKKSAYNFVFDAKRGLFLVAEQVVDHGTIAQSVEVLRKSKLITEDEPAVLLKGEFKMHPVLDTAMIQKVGTGRMNNERSDAAIDKLGDAVKALNTDPFLTYYSLEYGPS